MSAGNVAKTATNKGPTGKGFAAIPAAAFDLLRTAEPGAQRAFSTLALLLWHQGQNPETWPYLKTLAAEQRCTVRAVSSALKLLTEKGFITRQQRRAKPARTVVTIPTWKESSTFEASIEENFQPDTPNLEENFQPRQEDICQPLRGRSNPVEAIQEKQQQQHPQPPAAAAPPAQGVLCGVESLAPQSPKKRRRSVVPEPVEDPDFAEVYRAYPKHVGEIEAALAWREMNGSRPPKDVLLAAIKAQRAGWELEGTPLRFIPSLKNWLNGSRWKDEIAPSNGHRNGKARPPVPSAVTAGGARIAEKVYQSGAGKQENARAKSN